MVCKLVVSVRFHGNNPETKTDELPGALVRLLNEGVDVDEGLSPDALPACLEQALGKGQSPCPTRLLR
jgi:hypothetical protein